MLTESYKKRLLELSGILSEITSKEAFDKFYSDETKFPALKGDEELFNKVYDTAIREPYDFLFIDFHKKKEHPSCFRRKFDEFIIPTELEKN